MFSELGGSVLPSGFLGGSAPNLRDFHLSYIATPELPTLLLSARGLVILKLQGISQTGRISPKTMVASSGKLLPVKPDKISTNLLNALRNCKYRLKPIFENGLIRIYSTRDKFSLMELKFRYKCLSRNGLI